MSTPSRTAILKILRQHEKSLPKFEEPPLKPRLGSTLPSEVLPGLRSGKFVLLNRGMLQAIIKELSK
jgi:hypothetical protein